VGGEETERVICGDAGMTSCKCAILRVKGGEGRLSWCGVGCGVGCGD
jgi:hypothetical protein